MVKAIWKKGMVVAAVVMLCFLGVTPSLGGYAATEMKERSNATTEDVQESVIKIEVNEYKPDGTIETTSVPLAQGGVNELKKALLLAKNSDERFDVLKEYGLIPEEETLDDLKQGMCERAELMGITPEKVEKLKPVIKQRPPIMLDFFSKIDTAYLFGGSVRIGSSALIGYLNFLRGWNLPKADFFDVSWGLLGMVNSKGLLVEHSMSTFPGFVCLTGFVGYNVKLPLFAGVFSGYAAMTFAAGIGFHNVIFFYWLQGN